MMICMMICMCVHSAISGCKLLEAKTDVIHVAPVAPWLPGGKGADVAVCCAAPAPLGAGVPCALPGGAQLRPPQGRGHTGTGISSETTQQIQCSPRCW